MAKTSTAVEVGQEGSLREGLEAAIPRASEGDHRDGFAGGSGNSAGCAAQPAGGGAGRLPAWIEATEADPAHGHGSAGRAAGAAGGGRWQRA